MRFTVPALALACLMGGALPLAAQVTELPDPPDVDLPDLPPPPMGFAVTMHRTPGVEFLLARTGQLELTDAQVTKLAAIARRAADRHKAMHASMDSSMMHGMPGMRHDTTGMHQRMEAMREGMKKEHDAEHADLRDALAVLNPDQQAHAWEMVSERHHAMGGRGGNAIFMRRMGGDGHGVQIWHGPGPDGRGPDGADSMPAHRPPS